MDFKNVLIHTVEDMSLEMNAALSALIIYLCVSFWKTFPVCFLLLKLVVVCLFIHLYLKIQSLQLQVFQKPW